LDDEPLTETQSPAATDVEATVAVFENVVEGVQLTVTWPLCWFWTSIDEPVTAATDPEAPGPNEPWVGVVAAPATLAPVSPTAKEAPTLATRTDRRQRGR
jgi:hypothetical protein